MSVFPSPVPESMVMDRQTGGFQDSATQTYQSLFPPCPSSQSTAFSSAVDAGGLYRPAKELGHGVASGLEHAGTTRSETGLVFVSS